MSSSSLWRMQAPRTSCIIGHRKWPRISVERRVRLACFQFFQCCFVPLGLCTAVPLAWKSVHAARLFLTFPVSAQMAQPRRDFPDTHASCSLPHLWMCSPPSLWLLGILFPFPHPVQDGESEGGWLRGRAVPEILSISVSEAPLKAEKGEPAVLLFFPDASRT